MTVPRFPSPKIIVALLPEPETVPSCLDCALAAAEGFDVTIAAVQVGFDPRFAFVPPEELALQQLRARNEGALADRLAHTRAAIDSWRSGRGEVPVTFRDDRGDVTAVVAAETAAADLVVMGNPVHLDGRDAFHSTLFWSKRLLLVAPARPLPGPRVIGRHIVVGWKPGDQVRRAVRQALPWLAKAEKVSVVTVRKPAGVASDVDYGPSARAFFAELGLAVELIAIDRAGSSVGRQLLAETERLGGDSLLIGAFKHGALWEAVLGGVTRDVLAAAQLPVFMMS